MIFSDLVGGKEEMLVAWSEHVQIKMMRSNDFCVEMQVAPEDEKDNFFGNFYACKYRSKGKTKTVGITEGNETNMR